MGNDFQAGNNDDWDADEYTHRRGDVPAPPKSTPATAQAQREVSTSSPQPYPAHSVGICASAVVRAVPHKKNPRNFPGFIARSAMFRVSNTNEYFTQPTPVRAQGCTLMLSGPKLGMRDKHVWETAIQIAKERTPNIGEVFEIELRDFARRMGSSNHCGRALTSIWESLEKLARCRVEFEIDDSCKGIGSLLATAFREDGRLYLRLNPDFAIPALLGDKQFLFDQSRRRALPYALSQWLHDFFSTHKQSRDIDLHYLRELCGYDGSPRNFPGRLRSAMDALVAAAPGLVVAFEIEETGRCSDGWLLRVRLGNEKPSFLQAERLPAGHKSGRGRVVL
jgi:hypothetical protein